MAVVMAKALLRSTALRPPALTKGRPRAQSGANEVRRMNLRGHGHESATLDSKLQRE